MNFAIVSNRQTLIKFFVELFGESQIDVRSNIPTRVDHDLMLLDVEHIKSTSNRESSDMRFVAIATDFNHFDMTESFRRGALEYCSCDMNDAEVKCRITRLVNANCSKFRYDDLLIDMDRHLILRDSQVLHLRRKEFAILKLLVSADGKVLSRDEIADRTCEGGYADIFPGTVDVHISRLRKTIGNINGRNLIETVHGIGYRLSKDFATKTLVS